MSQNEFEWRRAYACVHADVPAGQGSESDAESRHGSQGSWNDGAEGDAAGFLCRTRRNPAEPVATRPQPGFIASGAHDIEYTLHQVECTRRQKTLPGGSVLPGPQGSADDFITAVEHSSLHEPQPVLGPIHKPPDRDASPSHARALTDLHAPRPGDQPSAAGVTMSRRSLMDPEMIERRKVVSDLMEANRALREKLMELHAGSSGASMLPYIRYTLYQITVTCVATHVTGGANRRRWRPFATPEA